MSNNYVAVTIKNINNRIGMIRHGTRLAGTEEHYGFSRHKLLSLRTPRAVDPARKARECVRHVDRRLTLTRQRRDLRDRANPKRSGADFGVSQTGEGTGLQVLKKRFGSGDRFTVERSDPPLHLREREREITIQIGVLGLVRDTGNLRRGKRGGKRDEGFESERGARDIFVGLLPLEVK